jgi:hypothetical protein
MAATDWILPGALIGGVVAYMSNFMGFKDWVDARTQGGEGQPVSPYEETGGSGKTVKEEEGDIIGKLLNPKPYVAPFSSGRSGNCSWDTKGGWCWDSSACGGKCRTCISGVKTTNVSDGCGRARNYFLNNYTKCSSCKKTPSPTSCTGPCPLGKRPGLVSGRCGCVNCTNTCSACYDRVSNCGCKFNASKIIHKDTNCSIGCNGYACWTNYPCINRGARAQKCVKSASCTTARAAWLAAYGCKSSQAYEIESDILTRVPTIV